MFYYDDGSGVSLGDANLLYELTGAHWADRVSVADGVTMPQSYPCSQVDMELTHQCLPSYRGYKKRAPRLYIRCGEHRGRHAVCALDAIPKGTIVTEYLGQWVGSADIRSNYRWGPIDGLHMRNYGGMVEDGFPNVAAIYLYNIDDIPLRIVFVAVEEIAAGEMVTVHYGMNHSVKILCHEEYRLQAMVRFFSANPLDKMVTRIVALRGMTASEKRWKHCLELENLVVKLRYLFQTPGALMRLMLDGVIAPELAFRHYDKPDFRYFILNMPSNPTLRQQEILSYVELIRAYFFCGHRRDNDLKEKLATMTHRDFFSSYLKGIIDDGTTPKAA